jgi:hypothetical protein
VQPRRCWSHFASEELRSPDFAVLEGLKGIFLEAFLSIQIKFMHGRFRTTI